MSDEKNVELGVFEALNALAEEKNASAETRETLRKNVRESSDAQQGTERRRPGRPKKEKAPEVPLDEAIAAGLTNLRNAKAKHAPAPKVAAPAASETEVASTLLLRRRRLSLLSWRRPLRSRPLRRPRRWRKLLPPLPSLLSPPLR